MNMVSEALIKKLDQLPLNLQYQIEKNVDRLLESFTKTEFKDSNTPSLKGFGSLKGKIWMSDDFDEPLEDFKDYM